MESVRPTSLRLRILKAAPEKPLTLLSDPLPRLCLHPDAAPRRHPRQLAPENTCAAAFRPVMWHESGRRPEGRAGSFHLTQRSYRKRRLVRVSVPQPKCVRAPLRELSVEQQSQLPAPRRTVREQAGRGGRPCHWWSMAGPPGARRRLATCMLAHFPARTGEVVSRKHPTPLGEPRKRPDACPQSHLHGPEPPPHAPPRAVPTWPQFPLARCESHAASPDDRYVPETQGYRSAASAPCRRSDTVALPVRRSKGWEESSRLSARDAGDSRAPDPAHPGTTPQEHLPGPGSSADRARMPEHSESAARLALLLKSHASPTWPTNHIWLQPP